jgi:hypothetical protein
MVYKWKFIKRNSIRIGGKWKEYPEFNKFGQK